MTGLIRHFWRHSAVLTNFTEYEVESRRSEVLSQVPPLAGLRQRSGPGRHQGCLEWWSEGCVHGTVRPSHVPTHSGPCRPYGARFAGTCLSPSKEGSLGGPWVLPTRTTHLARPHPTPGAWRTPTVDSTADVDGTTAPCTYDRFGTIVGEPRGTRTHPGYTGPDGILNGPVLDRFTGDYD